MSGHFLIGLALAAVVYHIVTTLMIYDNLRRRGIPVSFIWLRALGPKYAGQYRQITKKESGHTGPLFRHWIVSINVALVAAVAGAVLLRT